jgi:4-hydroxybenzoate polyprenyltransferase
LSRFSPDSRIIKFIVFGNFFYGLCAVALAIEASLQNRYPLNDLLFYLLCFSATVIYYSKAYLVTEVSEDAANVRSAWYARNRGLMSRIQLFFILIFTIAGCIFLYGSWKSIMAMNGTEWFLILVFPLVSVLYYGMPGALKGLNIRNVGWLKPFIIGFTWAGLVSVYPLLYYCLQQNIHITVTLVSVFLFIKNFMYVTVLCIMFDIKDYAMDYNLQLKTFVVNFGLRRTIFYVMIPLCVAGLASFIGYAVYHHFHPVRVLLNIIPFILIITVAYSLRNRRSIFYYLIIIDGLMLAKAIFGITGALFF